MTLLKNVWQFFTKNKNISYVFTELYNRYLTLKKKFIPLHIMAPRLSASYDFIKKRRAIFISYKCFYFLKN